MKKYSNAARAARRELLATAMLATLAISPAIPGPRALAQTADQPSAEGSGAIALPTVEVTATDNGFGGAGPGQDPTNTTYVLKDASTGTKTDTPVMDTPLNVQSIPQQVLRDQQVITLQQAVGGGTSGAGTAFANIVLRGFPTSSHFRNGFRVDTGGSNNTSIDAASTTHLANVASIEVLKGPAAILYGLSEPGGIVNIVTKQPLNAPYYSVDQQIGSFGLYRTSVHATGPVTKDGAWLYRMNMSYQNNGAPLGFPVDLVHAQNIFLAPVVKWNIDPATWMTLEAEYNKNRTGQFFSEDPLFNGAFVPIPRNRNYGESSPATQKTLFTALTWSHQFDSDWSVRQQLAYNRTDLFLRSIFPFSLEDTGSALVLDRFLNPQFSTATTYSTNVDIIGHIDTFGAPCS